eukprot:319298_1
MRAIENANKLNEIKCISVISGGSWGFIMWLYEATPDATTNNIANYISRNKETQWGTRGPAEISKFSNWFEHWSTEIQINILDMTSLKGKQTPKFMGDIRKQLNARGLIHADIYFVVESVNSAAKNAFIDYCWFRNEPVGPIDGFECAKTFDSIAYTDLKILRKDRQLHDINLLDVLSYCSSAWATVAGQANKHGHSTREFYGAPEKVPGRYDKLRLVDAGGTFNDPLVPYMIKERYKKSHGIEIWNFDFSAYGRKCVNGILNEIFKLREAMERVGEPIGAKEIKHVTEEVLEPGEYKFIIKDRVIVHCAMHGKYSRDEFIHFFKTMRSGIK